MKKLNTNLTFMIILILSFLVSCKPDQAPIEYSLTVKPMVGPNSQLQTDEDEPVRFVYSLKETLESDNKNTINLQVNLVDGPKFGKVTDCKILEGGLAIDCLYSPNANFNGEDKIRLNSKDGDFYSAEMAELLINVKPVPDAPEKVSDITVSVLQGATVVFEVPLAVDVDSSASQLKYIIKQNVQNGTLECFKDVSGVTIPGKRTCSYTPSVGFYGEDLALYNVKDEVNLEAPTNANIRINVTRQNYLAEEIFNQNNSSGLTGVDITWVIDNSGSMSDEQAALEANFSSFVDNFLVDSDGDMIKDKAKFPFKMIVTSTEAYISNRDKFRKDPATDLPWNLTSSFAESNFETFKANFSTAALMGVNGSGSERSLASAEALYNAKTDWYGGNDTLSIYIFLTDEYEQSSNKTIENWVAQFQALKDNPSKTRFYPIIRLNQDSGQRYANMAALTNGKLYDITQPFDEILDNISLTVTDLLDSYSLAPNRVLYENSLKVYINDVLQTSGWIYLNHGIKFETPPPADSVIRVTYNYSPGA